MAEPDDMRSLSREWQSLKDEAELSVPAALKRRRRQKALLVLEMLGGGLALACALFFWLAGEGVVYRVSAAVLVASVLMLAAVAKRTRVALGRWADWTPEGVLAFRLQECNVALLNAKCAFGSSAVLVVFASFVWLAAELEWGALPPGFHYLYAAIVAVTVLAVAIWARWRIRTKRKQRERLLALLEEIRDG